MSTKIHATVDALGNPTRFVLTGGRASDLAGADALLPGLAAATRIADRGYDAAARVLAPLREAGKTAVVSSTAIKPPKRDRKVQRASDRDLRGARPLAAHCFRKLKRFRAIATRDDQAKRNVLAGTRLVASVILLDRRHTLRIRIE